MSVVATDEAAIEKAAHAAEILRRNIRAEMGWHDIKQHQLGSAIGLSASSMSQAMTGHREFTFKEVVAIATHLGVPIARLTQLGRSDEGREEGLTSYRWKTRRTPGESLSAICAQLTLPFVDEAVVVPMWPRPVPDVVEDESALEVPAPAPVDDDVPEAA